MHGKAGVLRADWSSRKCAGEIHPSGGRSELCEENASATVEGTIKEIEDVTDENETEKTWLLWPDTERLAKSSCLYEGIFIHS